MRKTLPILALALLSPVANAAVKYVFADSEQDYTVTTPTFITSTATFMEDQGGQNGFGAVTHSATFTPGSAYDLLTTTYTFRGTNGTANFRFAAGTFGADGSYTSNDNMFGRLTVTGSPDPVPESSVLTALGLGAVALILRYQRA